MPKTAGTALRNHLIQQMGEDRVAPMVRGMSFRDALHEYRRFDAITGHIAAVPGDCVPVDRVSVTLLRNPFDRLLSEFFFSPIVHASGARSPTFASQSLDEWVLSRSQSDLDTLNPHVTLLWPFGRDDQRIPTIEERVSSAKVALDRFDLVGVQHLLHESITMLDFLMGWPAPDILLRDNHTLARPDAADIQSCTRVRLRELLAPDLDLFEYAKQRFAKQRRSILVLAARLNSVTVTNGVRSDLSPEAESPSRTGSSTTSTERNVASEPNGTREVVISSVTVSGDISGPDAVQTGEWVTIGVVLKSVIGEDDLTVGLAIRDHSGTLIFGSNTRLLGYALQVGPGQYVASFRFPNDLGVGRYSVTATAHRGRSHLERCFHWWENACTFEVVNSVSEPFEGRARLHMTAYVQSLTESSRLVVSNATDERQATLLALGRRNPELRNFRADLEALDEIRDVRRGGDYLTTLRITNSGSETWGAYGRQPVQVSYHWLASEGATVIFEGLRTPLPYDVQPGQSLQMKCFLRAPDVEGDAHLVWTLVQEEVAWFDAQDSGSRSVVAVRVVR